MGTILASTIITKAAHVLSDSANVRWTEAELLGWINTAMLEIASLKPNESVSIENIALVEGSKQSIAVTHLALIDVIRNMGAGAVPGPGIRPIERSNIDVAFADWQLAIYAEAVVQCFWFDEKDPKHFYVYPVQPSGTAQQIEVRVTVAPALLDDAADPITLGDTWEPAIIDYVLYRAFGKDTTSAPNRERSDKYNQSFLRILGVRTSLDPAYAADKDDLKAADANAPKESSA